MTSFNCRFTINQNYLNKLKELSVKKAVTRVGWFEDTKYEDGTPVAKVAEINEFGATIKVTDKMRKWFAAQGFPLNKNTTEIHIPARSFIRTTIDERSDDWHDIFYSRLEKVFDGKLTLKQALEQLGLVIKGDIQEKITQITTPPNSGMTVIMKGKDKPLINTGFMQETISVKTEVK